MQLLRSILVKVVKQARPHLLPPSIVGACKSQKFSTFRKAINMVSLLQFY